MLFGHGLGYHPHAVLGAVRECSACHVSLIRLVFAQQMGAWGAGLRISLLPGWHCCHISNVVCCS